MVGETRDTLLESRAFASAVLLEKIVRNAYENKRSSEVQPLQWSIMRYLGNASEDRCTVVWLASFLGVTHAPVARAVKTLQGRGYVLQQDNPSDGRSKILRLSDAGWQQLNADPLLLVAQRIERLEDDEKRALAAAVKQLIPQGDVRKIETDGFYSAG